MAGRTVGPCGLGGSASVGSRPAYKDEHTVCLTTTGDSYGARQTRPFPQPRGLVEPMRMWRSDAQDEVRMGLFE